MTRSDPPSAASSRLGPANRFGRRATDLRKGAGHAPDDDGEDPGEQQDRKNDDRDGGNQNNQDGAASGKDSDADDDKDGDQHDGKNKDTDGDGKGQEKDKARKKPGVFSKTWFKILVAVIVILLIVGAIAWWLVARDYENTDDAFIDTHIIQVSPQIAGQITALHVNDNQLVQAGDPLVDINAADANVRVLQVEAQKAQAETQIQQARATEAGAAAQAENAERDLARYRQLQAAAPAAVAQQQIDQALAAERNAVAQRSSARAQIAGAQKQIKVFDAQIDAAQINLGYTHIVAPVAGHVTQRNVAAGNYVTPGQTLLAIVPLQFWVTANFKETQLALMRPGQQVTLKIDACGSTEIRGHVDSIQSGAGQAFGILPPENATGNYVKVVQRVPVKILLDSVPQDCVLGPGMSVEPKVRVR